MDSYFSEANDRAKEMLKLHHWIVEQSQRGNAKKLCVWERNSSKFREKIQIFLDFELEGLSGQLGSPCPRLFEQDSHSILKNP